MQGKPNRRVWLVAAAALALAVVAYLAVQALPGSAGAVRHLSPINAMEVLRSDPQAVLVDVRTPEEFQGGHLNGALNLELDRLESLAPQALPNRNAQLVVYCRSGNRSSFAVTMLERMGYTKLVNVTGGIAAWAGQGLPVGRE